jgi:uncharacterized membrane protein YdjX (TVP38/TMEM64 family)
VGPHTGRDRVRLMLLLLAVIVGLLVARVLPIPSERQLRADVQQLGAFAPVDFILLYAFFTLLFLPKAVLSILAGATFGLSLGFAYVLVGAMAGAVIAFLLSRFVAREPTKRLVGAHLARLDEMIARNAFVGIVVARLIPVIPFTLINYVAGLTAIRLGTFASASAIGMIPGTFVYVSLGAFGVHPRTWQFWLAVTLALIMMFAGAIAVRRRRV